MNSLKGEFMPSISEFYGIKIYMYWDDYEQHHAEFHAAFGLNGKILRGEFPRTATKLVKKWILENKEVLYYAWVLATENKPLPKIQGLK